MKKILSVILSICMLLSITTGIDFTVYAASTKYVSGDWTYGKLEDGTIEILGYSSTNKNVVIPNVIDGYNVTKIGFCAFNCAGLNSVVIPEGITSIGDYAFRDFRGPGIGYSIHKFESIYLPSTIESIGKYAFQVCYSLKSINIPKSVRWIEDTAFEGCKNLNSISIEEGAFINRMALRHTGFFQNEANWEDSCLYLDNYLIAVTTNYSGDLKIKDGTKYIARYAFSSNTGAYGYYADISELTIPSSIKGIFLKGESKIKKINFLGSEDQWADIWFLYSYESNPAYYVKDLYINNKLLTNLYVYNSNRIFTGAFAGLKNLKKVNIGKNVSWIGEHAFFACENITDVYFNGTKSEWKKIDIRKGNSCLTDAVIHCLDVDINGHKHAYKSTITKATTSKNGKIVKKCSSCGKTTTTTIYYPKTVTLSKTSYTYNGKAKKPTVTVKDSKGNKINSKYYTVSYSNNKKVGTATATVKFKGNYSGTIKKNFKIVAKNSPTISNKTNTKLDDIHEYVNYKLVSNIQGFEVKNLNHNAKNIKINGYQLQYSKDKNFKKNVKTVKVKKDYKAKDLEANKTYYVRARVYKSVDDGKSCKIQYGKWSSPQSVYTKKDIEFNYSDSYFKKANNEAHKELALFSAYLSDAAYKIQDNKSNSENVKEISKRIASKGFGNIKISNNPEADHNVACFFASKKLNTGETLYIVSVRGTVGNEWISNAEMGGKDSTVHKGFETAMKTVKKDLLAYIGKNKNPSKTKILITGHSRGAAVANLLAQDLNDNESEYLIKLNIYCYTFACPNVALKSECKDSNNIYNYINSADFVPTLPLKEWEFIRNGKDIVFEEGKSKVNGKKISSANFKKNYKNYFAKSYKSFTEKTNKSLTKKMNYEAPDLKEFYKKKYKYQLATTDGLKATVYSCSASDWFKDLMKCNANGTLKNYGKTVGKTLVSGKLKSVTITLVSKLDEMGATHDIKTYYSWIEELD